MKIILATTVAAAALLAASGAQAQQSDGDGARAVSPDEYFGTRTRNADQDARDQDTRDQDTGDAEAEDADSPFYDDGGDSADGDAVSGDDSAEALNARQLRRMADERAARGGQDASDGAPSMAERLRARDEARRPGQDDAGRSDAGQTGADGATVTVTLDGVRRGGGDVYVALQTPSGFASGGGEYTRIASADAGEITVTFEGVAPGRYAAAAFQDADGDGTVTLGATGPTEPWGLSGGTDGAPSFDAAMFEVAGRDVDAEVTLTGDVGAVSRSAIRDRSRERGADMGAAPMQDTQAAGADGDADALRDRMRARRAAADGADPADAEPAEVTVRVTGLERRGRVFVALQDERGFAAAGGAYTKKARARRGEAEVTFEDVAPGRYAVAVFQDTDRDGTVTLTDTGPTEPWGFSGDVSGAPTFDAAAIDVRGDTTADVTVQATAEPGAMPARNDAVTDDMDAENRNAGNTRTEDRADAVAGDDRMGDMDMGDAGGVGVPERPVADAPALVYQRSASLSDDALTAKDYLDGELVDAGGDELADIKDVILDPRTSKARGVVLSSGGLFGLGADHYAVNFDRVTPERDGDGIVLRSALTEDDIERLRDFDYDAFKADKGGLLLASELRGADVALGGGAEAEVEDVVMTRSGGVEAIVLDMDDDLLVAPFARVEIGPDGTLSIRADGAQASDFPRYRGRSARRGLLRRQ